MQWAHDDGWSGVELPWTQLMDIDITWSSLRSCHHFISRASPDIERLSMSEVCEDTPTIAITQPPSVTLPNLNFLFVSAIPRGPAVPLASLYDHVTLPALRNLDLQMKIGIPSLLCFDGRNALSLNLS